MSDSKIVFLGTGNPNADPQRAGPAVAVIADGFPYLVDFGPGIVRRAAAAYNSGIEELAVSNLNRVFLTHLHSDHTAGYADLVLTPWVLERETPLEVFGPYGIRNMTENILAAYTMDIDMRIHGLEQANPSGCRVNVYEVAPGKVFEADGISVNAFAVNHGKWDAYGYTFHTSDRVITLSGDTAPWDGMIDVYKGSDVLVHEVYSEYGLTEMPLKWQRYHRAMHTSTRELARIAAVVQPSLLVLYHQLFHGVSEDELVGEVRAGYDGKVVSAKDLDVL